MLLDAHDVEAHPSAEQAAGKDGQLAPAAHRVQRGQHRGGQDQDPQQDHDLCRAARQKAGEQVVGNDLLIQVGGGQHRAVHLAAAPAFQRCDGVKLHDVPHKLPRGKEQLGSGDRDGLGRKLLPRRAGQRGPCIAAAGAAAVVGGRPRCQRGEQVEPEVGKNLHGSVIMGRQPQPGRPRLRGPPQDDRCLLGGKNAPQCQQTAPRQTEIPRGKGEGMLHLDSSLCIISIVRLT